MSCANAQRVKPETARRVIARPGRPVPAAMPRPARTGSVPTRRGSPAEKPAPAADRMRIAKAIAHAGLCSRRDAERWIGDGRVKVNGVVITSPALDVGPTDKVIVDDKALPKAGPVQMWRYHKPRGQVTTHRDPQGRPTVFENLPKDLPRVVSIGRLDFNTEGLLLLTTDGDLARHIELPATGWTRRYRVRAHGRIAQAELDKLKDGITIDGVRYGPIEATVDSMQGGNCWLTMALREGKNREVRNVTAALGLSVNRLIRVSFGPFQLLDLAAGTVEPIKRRVLADQLGSELSERFGLGTARDEAPSKRSGARAGTKSRRRDKKPAAKPRPKKT